MKIIILYLLLAVTFAQELDTHGDPFARPPYSWTELDISSFKAADLTRQVGDKISERLLMNGNGPAQIIKSNAIWTRESKINANEDFTITSYILYNYLIIARNQSIFECMTPVEEFTPVYKNYRWETSTNLRIFDTTCRLIPVRDCKANQNENKIIIDRKSPEALEARAAINDFIDKTLNPKRFDQLLYKVDVLMGVSCAYQQGSKICLDLYEQRISDYNVELRPCSGCMEKKADGTWDFGQPTCYPGAFLVFLLIEVQFKIHCEKNNRNMRYESLGRESFGFLEVTRTIEQFIVYEEYSFRISSVQVQLFTSGCNYK